MGGVLTIERQSVVGAATWRQNLYSHLQIPDMQKPVFKTGYLITFFEAHLTFLVYSMKNIFLFVASVTLKWITYEL